VLGAPCPAQGLSLLYSKAYRVSPRPPCLPAANAQAQ
jgi:hypothetical protein